MTWSTGASFFNPDYGLKAGKLADVVAAEGPLLVDDSGDFWVYDGGVWRPDVKEIKKRTVRALGERSRPAHLRAVRDVLAVTLGRIAPGEKPAGWFSGYLNFRNGMVRWDAPGEPLLLEHHPEYLSTIQLPIDWNPEAECQEFVDFLAGAVPADDLARAWEVLGYLLMPGNPMQRLFMLTGSGGNGKGVYLNVVRAILGDGNIAAVPLQEFSEDKFATAELFNTMANVCGDIDSTFIQNTGRIKELSGDDIMKGEFKFGQKFYFRFWGKAIFSANAIPGASDSSKGWLRRWEVLRFPYEPTKPDDGLSGRLSDVDSLEGIAVMAVQALRGLMAERTFTSGESSTKAHAEFAEKANKVIRWVNDDDSNVTKEEGVFNKTSILLAAFRAWEEHDSGTSNKPTGVQRFNELAKQAGWQPTARNGTRGYLGLRVASRVFVKEHDRPWLNVGALEITENAPEVIEVDNQMSLDLG